LPVILIAGLPLIKNQDQPCDPKRWLTKKVNSWHFGMKSHIRIDSKSGLIRSVTAASWYVFQGGALWRFLK